MSSTVACRRKARRHRLSAESDSRVEFDYPGPGDHACSMPIMDMTVAGFSFRLTEQLPGLEVGSNIREASLTIGACSMEGELVVMHVTDKEAGAICGVLFYPATDTDLVKMKSLIAGIEAVESR
jgi:hypothetical protein